MNIRDHILARVEQTLPLEPVRFCGQDVHVRVMTGMERDRWETAYLQGKALGTLNIRGLTAAYTVCDAEGNRLFKDEDAAALGKLPSAEFDGVVSTAQRLNKITEADIQELEGN